MPAVNFALGLKPEKAIEWLKTKQVSTESYRNLTASEIAKVYTIARMTDLDMLNDIKQSMIKAADSGQSFGEWRKGLLQHMANQGWLHPNGHNGQEIIDPKTGEIFGAPRRLDNIYRTNMQSAYQAAQYQTYMASVDNRPYWQYDAVMDNRTRPAHAAMDGLVYRYDDAFWTTFYPPNGYRCRCTVIALSEQDVTRHGLALSVSGEHNLVNTQKIYNKKGDSYPTKAFVAPDGSKITTDKGFGYNTGRINYRPDLDQYDRALAHEFAKTEMNGSEFKAAFAQINQEFYEVKKRLNIEGKPTSEQKIQIRNSLSKQFKFAAGVLSKETQELTGIKRATVWLSDDTLVKQVDSREGQGFGDEMYGLLPDILKNPTHIVKDKRELIFTSHHGNDAVLAVIKYVDDFDELYLQSYRLTNNKEISKLLEKKEKLK